MVVEESPYKKTSCTSNGKSRVKKLVNATENPFRSQGVNGHKLQWPNVVSNLFVECEMSF